MPIYEYQCRKCGDLLKEPLFLDTIAVDGVIEEDSSNRPGLATRTALRDTPRYDVGPPRNLGWWVVQVGDRDAGDPPAHVRVPGVGDLFAALAGLGLLDEDAPGAVARESTG